MTEISGAWQGILQGTNAGRVYIKIKQSDERLEAHVNVNDYGIGAYSLIGSGTINGNQISLQLKPEDMNAGLQLGSATVTGTIQPNGRWHGEWRTAVGTAGQFIADRIMPDEDSASQGSTSNIRGAFIMMRIDDNDPSLEDTLSTIRRACSSLDIGSIRVDDVEHTGKITDVILESIRNFQILICDLTYERPNVYYELGYAHGLGKEVILIARDKTPLHFDIKDYSVIYYKNTTSLEEKLKKRVAAVLEATNEQMKRD